MNDDPYEWGPAHKMLAEYDDAAYVVRGHNEWTANIPLRDNCTAELRVTECDPITAARAAIEMYRLVKYGPEVVGSAQRLVEDCTPFNTGDFDELEKALAHFPQENSNGLAE